MNYTLKITDDTLTLLTTVLDHPGITRSGLTDYLPTTPYTVNGGVYTYQRITNTVNRRLNELCRLGALQRGASVGRGGSHTYHPTDTTRLWLEVMRGAGSAGKVTQLSATG